VDIRGVIFDLDGTLVDSRLDFDLIRSEMGIPPGEPVLEMLQKLPAQEADIARAILDRHELEGAKRATVMPGVQPFLAALERRNIRRAVITRNAGQIARQVLARHDLHFEHVIGRDEGPVKPDPGAIRRLCSLWQLDPAEVAMVGDFHFDIQAGRRAGAVSVLYTAGRTGASIPWSGEADLVITAFDEAEHVLFPGGAM